MMLRRLSITVHGRVQGVGFRFFACNHARKFKLSGWVQNRSDDCVEMEVQGTSEELEAFKIAIHEGPVLARVYKMQVVEMPVAEGEEGFEVRH